MFYIGCHLSASDGFLAMGRTALSIGANTFQFFTRNPRGSKAKAIDPADVAAFLALALMLPFLTGQIPQIGSMLSPMHIPVLLGSIRNHLPSMVTTAIVDKQQFCVGISLFLNFSDQCPQHI